MKSKFCFFVLFFVVADVEDETVAEVPDANTQEQVVEKHEEDPQDEIATEEGADETTEDDDETDDSEEENAEGGEGDEISDGEDSTEEGPDESGEGAGGEEVAAEDVVGGSEVYTFQSQLKNKIATSAPVQCQACA